MAAIAAGLFLIVHAIYVGYWAKHEEATVESDPKLAAVAARLPEHISRHSFGAQGLSLCDGGRHAGAALHGISAQIGMRFAWVQIHWIAGIVLIVSVLFHIIHASFVLDFWSIWPDKQDFEDASNRLKRAMGKPFTEPRKFGKYPLENKMFHLAVLCAGLSVICTGIFMLFRVRTPFFTRNPYMLGDETWGLVYVLHGLAGVGFIALVMMHIYFAIRPEKLFLTKSMIFGWITAKSTWPALRSRAWHGEEGGSHARARQVTGSGDLRRCGKNSRRAATPSKNVTSSCWPTPRKALPMMRAANLAASFADISRERRRLLQVSPSTFTAL